MPLKTQTLLYLTLISVLAGCSSSRYQYNNDHHPDDVPPLTHIEDAVPRYEPYSRGGNSNYRVRGIDYPVFNDITSFSETGYASWYGNKFHGHLTSNGERYDMYAMSAAHKNLPLPSYVRVTNLENEKSVIVRVNDRGPFHEGRIIDLSYVAAHKLDIIKSGTAKVEIELIHIPVDQNEHKNDYLNGFYYVQYLVTSQQDKANKLGKQLSEKYAVGQSALQDKSNYRLRLGPLNSEKKARKLLEQLQKEYPGAFIVHQKKR
ncbi:septal ring lytic transglycosylase RlpA [Psychromonas sp. psych-6C06]|uniref:septal ring lytic transglycosylase RlpA family protein n=1 Tax=Psychromonas sp. psych-6C06 TaxID=2058089 RepID=UPI000C34F7A0|nr:septal ring lytic transglycosylase RlpA family protein [Psychromonas sp. psych-6C06]PKF62249.1 septal ring lytic transglycosylase RlpA [Psychromonas sp. psych-6C06]